MLLQPYGWIVATVPTACGIETHISAVITPKTTIAVATVPTACGIETIAPVQLLHNEPALQQYLPLAVLKRRNRPSDTT